MSVDEVLPRALGPYELLARIGRGGMGDVYWARHGMLSGFEKHCVLKMLRDDRASDPELLARFADEARVVVQLTHRNICPVFDVGRVGDRLYVVLEHIVGRDLRTVALLQPLPLPIALHIVGEVCEALDYAHRFVDRKTGAPLGLVHRDVSPHNVLLGVDGDTKLIDFGIATTAVTAAPSQEVLGKLAYMSPEHARGEVVDHRSDQFATAVMLTELVLGERFHGELSTAEIHAVVGTGTWRPARFASIDAGLRAILERALAPRPADRWSSMGDFADALSAWATKQSAIATPRDVRRHLLAVCGDLAAEHRAALAHIDAAPPVADAAVVDAPAAVDDDGQFESIATTLALPGPTPAFGSIPATLVLNRAAVRAATSKKRSSLGLVAAAAALGVAVGALGVVVAWPRPVAEPIVMAPAPAPPEPEPSTPEPSTPEPPPEPPEPPPEPPEPPPEPEPSKSSKPSKPKQSKPSSTRRTPFDPETTRALATLRGCVDKVPCAQGVIEWSNGAVSSATARAEIKDAATACAKRCRLK